MPEYVKNTLNQETIAAIDLGSNALRAIIVRKDNTHLEVIKSFRVPLRLGEDVFTTGSISPRKMLASEEAFIKLFHTFTEYNVTQVSARATSAMRDSNNAPELINRVKSITGIEIQIIKGIEEARLIFEAVKGQVSLAKKTAILMDIGGGSTEIVVVKNGLILGTESFNVGTVRLMQYENPEELEEKISLEINKIMSFIRSHLLKSKIQVLVGTGGNLRRIGKIRKKILGRSTSELALFNEVKHMEESISRMSYVERIRKLELDQNRADVILPAIMLTRALMKVLKQKKILLPKVGLKEGIVLSMLKHKPDKFILKD
jgi:exopolyphosphatase/guanosine-5'-triphosphate,3'-diphosphate pyrophosphatase